MNTMERVLTNGDVEDRKMEGKAPEENLLEPEPDSWLDLKLSNFGASTKSNPEPKLMDFLGKDTPELLESPFFPVQEMNAAKQHKFPCKFCNRKFTNSQALGGHQNAHKSQRAALKREKELESAYRAGLNNSPFYPFSPVTGIPGHPGDFNRPLGVNMQSMIHKPPHHSLLHAAPQYGYDYAGSSWSTFMNPPQVAPMQPNYDWATSGAVPSQDAMGFNRMPPVKGAFWGPLRSNLDAITRRVNSQTDISAGGGVAGN